VCVCVCVYLCMCASISGLLQVLVTIHLLSIYAIVRTSVAH